MKYLITFAKRGNANLRRFRPVESDTQPDAVHAALKSLRGGAVLRYSARNPEVMAYVSPAAGPMHQNGIPMVVTGYSVRFGKDLAI